MEKLELKHLSPYLPYDLKWYCLDKPSGEFELNYMTGIFSYAGEMQVQVGNYDISLEDDLENDEELFKPILKPKNQILENLISNYDRFEQWGQEWINHVLDFQDKLDEVNFDACPYDLMQHLLENHYDLYGLIGKGLAVDINELN